VRKIHRRTVNTMVERKPGKKSTCGTIWWPLHRGLREIWLVKKIPGGAVTGQGFLKQEIFLTGDAREMATKEKSFVDQGEKRTCKGWVWWAEVHKLRI